MVLEREGMVHYPVLTMSTNNSAQDQQNFVLSSGPRPAKLCSILRPKTSKTLFELGTFFSFYLELYKNTIKNLIQTSKFKCSFQGLVTMLKLPWENTTHLLLLASVCRLLPLFCQPHVLPTFHQYMLSL